MTKAANSIIRSSNTAPARCGMPSQNIWWQGSWRRSNPPAVPVASDCGEDS